MKVRVALFCTLFVVVAGATPSSIGYHNKLSTADGHDFAEESQMSATGATSLGEGLIKLQEATQESENDSKDIVIGDQYNWSTIRECLSDGQRGSVDEVVSRTGYSREQMRYSVESDGNILFYSPPDFNPIAETVDGNFQCNLVQDIVTVTVTPAQTGSSSTTPTDQPPSTQSSGQDGNSGDGGPSDSTGADGRSLAVLAGFILTFAMFAVVMMFVLYILYREYYKTDNTTTRT